MSKITKEELETLSESQKKYAAIKHDLDNLKYRNTDYYICGLLFKKKITNSKKN